MAPEQARSQAVDARTDLFAVGLVAYFAATGDRLYRGETLLDLLNRAAVGPGVEELERVASLPAPLPEILDWALAVDPTERFQTAAQFRAAIATHLEGGRAEVEEAMKGAFLDDLRLEQERLNRACPRALTPAPVAA
jgi:serine/threonine-protein kinase